MTVAEMYTLLNSITTFKGKVAYNHFSEDNAPALPFIAFYVDDTDNFKADNKVYLKRSIMIIELYTAKKDPTVEEALESALDAAGIPYDYTETYIESEKLYQISYEVEV